MGLLASACCTATAQQAYLNCSTRTGDVVRPQSAEETSRIRQAPHGATRKGRRELDVLWSAGTRKFTDKPPYDADLDGVWWAYCGYSLKLGLHLILEQNVDNFTGLLLDDKTGQLLPGGKRVLFSPGLKRYLAFEQPDGQDGETIKLCTREGIVLWKGQDRILAPDGVSINADLENVHWNEKSQVVAESHVSQGKKEIVRLIQTKPGKWQWSEESSQ